MTADVRHSRTASRKVGADAACSDPIATLAASGWTTCSSVREGIIAAGLPVPDEAYLRKTFDRAQWETASRAVEALRVHFAEARFAEDATFGLLLVPDVVKLDTRGRIDDRIRRGQMRGASQDFVDKRMPAGRIVVPGGRDWTIVSTITGSAGIHLGAYSDIVAGPSHAFSVLGVDTRRLMVRQLWGARALQSGTVMPDSTDRDVWTFTLFPGEGLTDAKAASGTVLHGKVRFRLGQTDRGISSVRVCPAVIAT